MNWAGGPIDPWQHLDGCPLRRPELYDPSEWPLECECDEIRADGDES